MLMTVFNPLLIRFKTDGRDMRNPRARRKGLISKKRPRRDARRTAATLALGLAQFRQW
ncbi:MAG: hypothetical protein HQL36_10490, partial [Alphaproteobacteria bacterium]|nr:hypothetical protein [Alphaproteobacteria bacterium]